VEERDYWVVAWDRRQVLTLPAMRQVVAVRKRWKPVDPSKVEKIEWRYYGTSCGPEEANVEFLARTIRGHWQIENCLHYPKDYTMGEDRHLLRKGKAPIVLSHLRSIVLGLLRLIEIPGLVSQTHPQKMAYLSGNLDHAVRALALTRPIM
jgi:predicted transposase YbfD/YdcC